MSFDRNRALEPGSGIVLDDTAHLSSGAPVPTIITHPNALVGDRYFRSNGEAYKFNGTVWIKIVESDEDSNGASPGWTFGNGGNSGPGTYLHNADVPSNIVGVPIGVTNPRLKKISVANQNANIWSVTIVEHDGTNFTDITTVTVSPASRRQVFVVDLPLTQGLELGVKIADASANSGKNAKVTCIIRGTV